METKIYKEFRDGKNVSHLININKQFKADFEVWQSNYTTTIFYPKTGYKHKFNLRQLDKKVFFIYAKLKKQISLNTRQEFWQKNFEKDINFFEVNPQVQPKEIFNLDLKNAYPSALMKSGYIDAPTCKYIEKQHKLHRLQAIGMFASRKSIFDYVQGYLCQVRNKESELRNVYFYAAKVTDNIMKAAKYLSKDKFVFYWFDGIYIENCENTKKLLLEFFADSKIEIKTELLTNLEIEQKRDISKIIYTDSKGTKKIFNVPHPQVRDDNIKIIKSLK